MPENVGETIAKINGKLDTLIAKLEGADARLGDRLIEAERERNRIEQQLYTQGERFGQRLDVQDSRLKAVENEVAAFRNRALGAIVFASVLTGGSVVGISQIVGG